MKKHRPVSPHLTSKGEVHLVDVGAKGETTRTAEAIAVVTMSPATLQRLRESDTPKGDVLATVRIAGIQGAKRTSDIIPLCHTLSLTHVSVDIALGDDAVRITARTEAHDRTGVEMEAMVAASTAALTLYDMLKGIDRAIAFSVHLTSKRGGKSGDWVRSAPATDLAAAPMPEPM